MRIEVAQAHITNGVEKDSHHCMIADAIKAAVQSIRFSRRSKKMRFTYLTPPIAQQQLLKFDRGVKAIQPFEFDLKMPTTRMMGWKGQRSPTANRKGKQYRRPVVKKKAHALVAYKEREFGLRKFVVADSPHR